MSTWATEAKQGNKTSVVCTQPTFSSPDDHFRHNFLIQIAANDLFFTWMPLTWGFAQRRQFKRHVVTYKLIFSWEKQMKIESPQCGWYICLIGGSTRRVEKQISLCLSSHPCWRISSPEEITDFKTCSWIRHQIMFPPQEWAYWISSALLHSLAASNRNLWLAWSYSN